MGRRSGTIHLWVILTAYFKYLFLLLFIIWVGFTTANPAPPLKTNFLQMVFKVFAPSVIRRGLYKHLSLFPTKKSVSLLGHQCEAERINKHASFYLFWWCCTTHRAGVCCLLQCPGAAPCSCWVRTPHPAYLCPGTAGRKTHRNCNSTASHIHRDWISKLSKRYDKEKKRWQRPAFCAAAGLMLLQQLATNSNEKICVFLNESGLSSCHSQRQSHSSQHHPPPHPYTPLHWCILAQGSPRSPERRPPEPHSSD